MTNMCGRFTLRTSTPVLTKRFRREIQPLPGARFNIAPTQPVLVIREQDSLQMHWGLIPSWAKDPGDGRGGARMINCRSETAAEKPSFRSAFKKRRCLVIADGYYEWERVGKQRLPWHIHRTDKQPFAMAGLWESWQPDQHAKNANPKSAPLLSCTVLTTTSNERTSFLHDRMPVILSPNDEQVWLNPELQTREQLEHLFEPFPSEDIDLRPVSTHVNNARHEGEGCLEPRPTQGELF